MSNKKNKAFKLEVGTGTLHKSVHDSTTTEGSPDYYGTFNLGGINLDISGWKKVSPAQNDYVAISVGNNDLTIEERTTIREANKKAYLEEKKTKKDEFVLMNGGGTMHRQKDASKKEDYFLTLRYENKIYHLAGKIAKAESGATYLWLSISEGALSKDERTELAENFA